MRSLVLLQCLLCAWSKQWKTQTGEPPRIIGHRGDPYFTSPHTLASYSIAISEGDTVIEPDLAMTKDGVIVVAHDPWLGANTDVDSKLPGRRQNIFVDFCRGHINDTFAMDLTLEELRSLRIVQDVKDISKRDNYFDGFFGMPTLEEMIQFVQARAKALGKRIDIVPELKHVQMYARSSNPLLSGTSFPDELLAVLLKYGYDEKGKGPYGDVSIQCFDHQPLQYLASKTQIPGIMLVAPCSCPETVAPKEGEEDWRAYFKIRDPLLDARPLFQDWLLTPGGIKEASAFAGKISPYKGFFKFPGPRGFYLPLCRSGTGYWHSNPKYHRNIAELGGLIEPQNLVQEIHDAGMAAVTWTARNRLEDPFVNLMFHGDVWCELQEFMEMGIDYIFCEKSMDAIAVLKLLSHGQHVTWCSKLSTPAKMQVLV